MKLNIKILSVKMTRSCNATCSHCSANWNTPILSLNNFKKTIDKIAPYVGESSTIMFHGGEPTLLGVDYYNKLIEYIENNYPGKFKYLMQSNMLLYNSEWFELVKNNNIILTTSYDFFTDIRNIKGNVNKYWDIWYKNIKQFQKDMTNYTQKQFYPYIINIVTKQNYTKYNEIYEIAKKEKFNIRYNNYWKVGRGDNNSDKYYIEPEEYGKFLINLLNLYIEDIKNNNFDKNLIIYPIHYFYEKILKNYELECPWINNCAGMSLLLENDGTLYNCHTFSDIKKFSYGNIFKINDLQEITKTDNFKKLYNRRLKLPNDCLKCKYYKYCKGGCMRDSYINDKSFGDLYSKTWGCKAWYGIIDKIIQNFPILNKNIDLKNAFSIY